MDSSRPLSVRPAHTHGVLLLAVCIALALLLAGCRATKPAADPYADIRQAWRPGFELSAAQLAAMPSYSITVTIDPAQRAYTGTLELTLPISTTQPLTDLYFRTYPNLYAFGGELQINGASVNGANVNFTSAASRTAVQLVLPKPLVHGDTARVWLSFLGKVERESKAGEYTIFGINEDIFSLTNFYPILAARRGTGWALDVPYVHGDVGFHDAALYRVQVTMPPGLIVAATGSELSRTVDPAGWVTAHYVIGPAREFNLLMSATFQVLETETLGTRVRSYFKAEDRAAGQSALYDAIAALQIYSDRFGAYPYREMAIVQAPLTYHGMEFPGISLIGSQVYNKFTKDLETLVVHEVAHQWWYNQVGSDQVLSPWLDEGLTEFSMYYYYAGRYGEAVAKRLRASRWETPLASVVQRGEDQPIGLPVWDYEGNYETLVYGKGALLFATLQDELGAAAVERLLRTYVQQYQWQIATPTDFQALANRIAGRNLDAIYTEWIYGSPTQGQ